MDSISARVANVAPSLTLSVTNQAKAMKARGEEVYGLAGGEPDQDTPDFIKQAAVEALAFVYKSRDGTHHQRSRRCRL